MPQKQTALEQPSAKHAGTQKTTHSPYLSTCAPCCMKLPHATQSLIDVLIIIAIPFRSILPLLPKFPLFECETSSHQPSPSVVASNCVAHSQ